MCVEVVVGASMCLYGDPRVAVFVLVKNEVNYHDRVIETTPTAHHPIESTLTRVLSTRVTLLKCL